MTALSKMTSPLCFMPDGRIVCYRKGCMVVYVDNKEKFNVSIPVSGKEKFLRGIPLFSRFFRLGVRATAVLDNENILLSRGNMIHEFNLDRGELSAGWFCGEGIRPLIFTNVNGITDIKKGIYFGDYLSNDNKNPVNVYYRIGVDQWEIVYTFSQGEINHVHNIVADPYRSCLWIFTGDFGEASAIWKITDHFKNVERVVCNDQKYRACVAYALPEGLLYATDAPFTDNYIYLMNPETLEVKELFPTHGSCIYGCKWKDKYVFSSTVEGDGRNMSRVEWLFTQKRGAGIKDNYVHMYMGNLKEGFKEIYKEEKDCMPYYTFQFGVFKFPSGENNGDILYFQPVATKKNDLCLMSLNNNKYVYI